MNPSLDNVAGTKTTGLSTLAECADRSLASSREMSFSSGPSRERPSVKRPATPPGHKLQYPVNPTVIQLIVKPKTVVNHSYRDFSEVTPDSRDEIPQDLADMSFAQKIHEILSIKAYQGYISWMPHGRAFRVLVPKRFEMKVTPIYFGHSRYSTFLRQLNNHGFKHITQGADRNCYYHEAFLRGLPYLCKYMPRGKNRRRIAPDVENEPNFYRISETYPVPEGELIGTVRPSDEATQNKVNQCAERESKCPAEPRNEVKKKESAQAQNPQHSVASAAEHPADTKQEARIECAEAVALAQQQAIAASASAAAAIATQRQAVAAAALAQQGTVAVLAQQRLLLTQMATQRLALQSLGCPTSAQPTLPLHTSHLPRGSNSALIAALASRLGSTDQILGMQNSSSVAGALGVASSLLGGQSNCTGDSANPYLGYNFHR